MRKKRFSSIFLAALGSSILFPAMVISGSSNFGKIESNAQNNIPVYQAQFGVSAGPVIEVGQRVIIDFQLVNSGADSYILYSYDETVTVTNPEKAKITAWGEGSAPGFDTPPDTFDFPPVDVSPASWQAASVNNTNSGQCDAVGPTGPVLEPSGATAVTQYRLQFEGLEPGEYIMNRDTTGLRCLGGETSPAVFEGGPFTITVTAPVVAASIPTLSEWGIIFLTMLLSIGAVFYIRGHRSA